jgi:phosphatidylglycerol:prolipoprotein diacylglycerol transferase
MAPSWRGRHLHYNELGIGADAALVPTQYSRQCPHPHCPQEEIMQPNPVLVRIGPIAIYWYGLLIVGGSMLAAYVASKLSSRNGHDPEIAWNMLIVCLVSGIIGARAYHVIHQWDYYSAHTDEIVSLQMSGFGIYGAVVGGAIGVWVYAQVKKLRFLEWADYIAPGLILAQAIGRWGNFFNQELYGRPVSWGIYIAPEHREPGYEAFERFHPTFLYESVLNFAGFLILFYLARNWRKNRLYGDLFLLYGIIYPVIRFFIEPLRLNVWTIGGLPTAQWVSIVSVLFCGLILFLRRRLRRPDMIYVPGEPWQPPQEKEEAPASEAAEAAETDADAAVEAAEAADDATESDVESDAGTD